MFRPLISLGGVPSLEFPKSGCQQAWLDPRLHASTAYIYESRKEDLWGKSGVKSDTRTAYPPIFMGRVQRTGIRYPLTLV